ncbi:sensory rhodopsin transducer [Paenibacillus sp.]|uniref:sensory rhodopsin transducer n=1 Tax=Paenibacillus sp. TaxID=58172 RepID=UPI002D47DC78|nr:sensory rhodopsin transducer [Paenibacillus sp.]HZG56656.1 sensory rhodopsin transducer [Paenibacillus sp.]
MSLSKGHTLWYIPDGYIPPVSTGTLISHESICVLNANAEAANLSITIFFEDRDPLEDVAVRVEGRRTAHVRTSTLERDGQSIPVGVPYAMEVRSDVPIIVQYSRMDATQPANTLATTMGFPVVG